MIRSRGGLGIKVTLTVAGLLQAMAADCGAHAAGASAVGAEASTAAIKPGPAPELTAAQVIERYVSATGGEPAWHKIQAMAWAGRIETGPGGISKLPFLMLFRRPDATHFELLKEGQRAVRIFDGKLGWRLRPTSTGLPEVKEYTDEEISYARDAGGLDGPLVDFKAKGISVVLEGTEDVEGHTAYRLGLTLPSGRKRSDWIDAHSFLDLKYQREMHDGQGRAGVVTVYLRNYQVVEGLTMPFIIETGNGAGRDSDRMVIEKVELNPSLPDNKFTKPVVPTGRHNGVLVDTTSAR